MDNEELMSLPVVRGMDWNEAYSKLRDVDFIKEMVVDFYNSLDEAIADLGTLVNQIEDEEKFQLYRIKAHALKTTSATVGAMELFLLAKECEFTVKDNEPSKTRELTPKLLELIQTYKDNLKEYVDIWAEEIEDI